MTFIEKFNDLKAKYGKIDESKLGESFALQVEMTDPDCGGVFYIAYVNGLFSVEPYDYRDNTVSVKITSALLEEILSGKKNAEDEYKNGNIELYGNAGHAISAINLMKKEPSAPAKKSSAKKDGAPKKETKKKAKAEETPQKPKRTGKTKAE